MFKKGAREGCIACSYLILYACVRIFVEHLRVDSVMDIAGFPVAQVVSVILLIVGIVGLIRCKN